MYHSLRIGNKNTWDDWHIVPDSRPVINPPGVKTNYVNVPGTDGALDYTEALSGLRYENRQGSWTFYVMNDYGQPKYDYKYWHELYSAIVNHLHGNYLPVYSEDDPLYLYYGRLSVNAWNSEKDYSKITINYVLEPYKHKVKLKDDGTPELDENGNPKLDTEFNTADFEWYWDDLFDASLTILYGRFQVDGTKCRSLVNRIDDNLEISVKCSSPMEYELNGGPRKKLKSGMNRDSGIFLKRGVNRIKFYGNGEITINLDKNGVII